MPTVAGLASLETLVSGRRICALAIALAMGCARSVEAESGSEPLGIGSAVHVSYASTAVGDASGPVSAADILAPPPLASAGALVISPTFDSSITSSPNAAAIEAVIADAIAVFESLFDDPITVSILFR